MPTIGLEATRANKAQKTGTEWYAWHLLEQFKKLAPVADFKVYYKDNLQAELLAAPSNFRFVKLAWPWSKLWTHLRLGMELMFRPVDKFFASNALPILCRGQKILTIHDLGFLKNPELYHPLERLYQIISHRLAIAMADKIITISDYSRNDIVRYFPAAAAKIRVIHLGWDQTRFKPLDDTVKRQVISDYKLPQKYLFYIGRIETKKNLQNLIRAYKLLDTDVALVLGGRAGNYGFTEIQRLASDKKIINKIHFLGYVSPVDHPRILAAAKAFVFSSKFEGFGLPILEAMGSGVPVLCSDIPAHREIGEAAALFFNPDDVADIAEKINDLLNNTNKQQELIERGLIKCRDFSWAKCARETLDYILEKNLV